MLLHGFFPDFILLTHCSKIFLGVILDVCLSETFTSFIAWDMFCEDEANTFSGFVMSRLPTFFSATTRVGTLFMWRFIIVWFMCWCGLNFFRICGVGVGFISHVADDGMVVLI